MARGDLQRPRGNLLHRQRHAPESRLVAQRIRRIGWHKKTAFTAIKCVAVSGKEEEEAVARVEAVTSDEVVDGPTQFSASRIRHPLDGSEPLCLQGGFQIPEFIRNTVQRAPRR